MLSWFQYANEGGLEGMIMNRDSLYADDDEDDDGGVQSIPRFGSMRRRQPPFFDGSIVVELSDRPVQYHFSLTYVGGLGAQQCHTLAMAACRMACRTADVVRGKIGVEQLRRAMTTPCIQRLQTMQHLLEMHMLAHPETKARLCYLPAIPHMVNGVLTSSEVLELCVIMTIGNDTYMVDLKFRYIGSRWMCQFVDIG